MRPLNTCQICSKRSARLVLLRYKGGVGDRTFICWECAAETTKLYAGGNLGLLQLRRSDFADDSDSPRCPLCGTVLLELGGDIAPGCCECYIKFADILGPAIRDVQGSGRHVGKNPGR